MVVATGCSKEEAKISKVEKDKTDKIYKWKMLTIWPKNFPGLGTGANNVATLITKMSGDRIQVKVYGAKELVPAFEVVAELAAKAETAKRIYASFQKYCEQVNGWYEVLERAFMRARTLK
jgi:TRAP-type mannitol/chloroaromatic compound transport system substrate-binding protein